VSSVALALAGMVALGLSACSKKERPEMEISRAFAGCWITQDKIRAIYNVLESDDKHDFSGIKFKTTQFYVVPETKKAYRIDYNALYSENQEFSLSTGYNHEYPSYVYNIDRRMSPYHLYESGFDYTKIDNSFCEALNERIASTDEGRH